MGKVYYGLGRLIKSKEVVGFYKGEKERERERILYIFFYGGMVWVL